MTDCKGELVRLPDERTPGARAPTEIRHGTSTVFFGLEATAANKGSNCVFKRPPHLAALLPGQHTCLTLC